PTSRYGPLMSDSRPIFTGFEVLWARMSPGRAKGAAANPLMTMRRDKPRMDDVSLLCGRRAVGGRQARPGALPLDPSKGGAFAIHSLRLVGEGGPTRWLIGHRRAPFAHQPYERVPRGVAPWRGRGAAPLAVLPFPRTGPN